MAEILPFRALHYDAARVALRAVVTQPYDKISAEMQARYYAASPYNLARIIRRRPEETPEETESVYSGAARDFNRWIREGVLVPDASPAFYAYDQEYTLPGHLASEGARQTRHGFIALLKLEDYSAGVVYRHEETLSGPKADRLELLKATRSHFGQIFMLYSDPEGAIETQFAAAARAERGRPWERVEDECGTRHAVRRVADGAAVEPVVAAMRQKKLIIADGHHRYETALAYRDRCRAQSGGKADEPAEYVMATFVRMETDGLTILPTHRVVHHLMSFDWEGFLAAAQPQFEHLQPAATAGGSRPDARGLPVSLGNAGRARPAFAVYAGPGKLALLRLRDDVDLAQLLPDLPSSLAGLDVVVLHRILFERVLGIDREAVREERNLRYVREPAAALSEVDRGAAQVCFLMNPTPIGAVRDNAFAGQVLPQKSTDFYPKLLSGLTIYWLDQPGGK